jgi:hypothetical protein
LRERKTQLPTILVYFSLQTPAICVNLKLETLRIKKYQAFHLTLCFKANNLAKQNIGSMMYALIMYLFRKNMVISLWKIDNIAHL